MSGRLVIEAEAITKSFGGRTVLEPFSTRILRGDRVGVIGPNGAGKTTLLQAADRRARAGQRHGAARHRPRDRALRPAPRPARPRADALGDAVPARRRPRRGAWATRATWSATCATSCSATSRPASPSRRCPAASATGCCSPRSWRSPANLLILDEPTNDLDIETLDLLEEMLADHAGHLAAGQPRPRLRRPAGDLDHRVRRCRPSARICRRLQRLAAPAAGTAGHAGATVAPGQGALPPAGRARSRPSCSASWTACPTASPRSRREIASCRGALADPGLYARDPSAFARASERARRPARHESRRTRSAGWSWRRSARPRSADPAGDGSRDTVRQPARAVGEICLGAISPVLIADHRTRLNLRLYGGDAPRRFRERGPATPAPAGARPNAARAASVAPASRDRRRSGQLGAGYRRCSLAPHSASSCWLWLCARRGAAGRRWRRAALRAGWWPCSRADRPRAVRRRWAPQRRRFATRCCSAAMAGLLAWAIEPTMRVWQAPPTWTEALAFSPVGGGLALALLLGGHLVVALARGRALRLARGHGPVPAALPVHQPVPALLRPSARRHRPLSSAIGRWFGWYGEATFGRIVLLFLFNEITIVGGGWLIDGHWTRSWRLRAPAAAQRRLAQPLAADRELRVRRSWWRNCPGSCSSCCLPLVAPRPWRALGPDLPAHRPDARRDPRPPSRRRRQHPALARGCGQGRDLQLRLHGCWSSWRGCIQTPRALAGRLHRAGSVGIAGRYPALPAGPHPHRELRRLARRSSTACAPTPPSGPAMRAAWWSAAASRWRSCSSCRCATPGPASCSAPPSAPSPMPASTSLRDLRAVRPGERQHLQIWRVYALGALLGGITAGAVAWYLDAAQIAVIAAKLAAYATVHGPAPDYIVYPLFSKYGALSLGPAEGGVRLLYNESLSGVINWSLAAPLFSINLVFLTALLQRSTGPIRMPVQRPGRDRPGRAGDPRPALGPVDGAGHLLVPAHGAGPDLVRPGRRGAHRRRHAEELDAVARRTSAPGASRSSWACSPTTGSGC